MLKAFKFQLLPTEQQKVLLMQHFGCRRFVWNYFLNKRKDEYLNNKKTLNYYDCANQLTILKTDDDYVWLKDVNSQMLQHTLRDLDTAYNRFFRKIAKFPNFKSKHNRQSFRVPQHIVVEDGKIYFPKFKEGIKVNVHREFGEIAFITISRTPTGKFFVALTCECKEAKKLKPTKNNIGVDLGIKEFAVCSNGDKFANPKHYQKVEKNLKFNQRVLSKRVKGGTSRNKQRIKVALLHERVANSRLDFLHKLSKKLIDENQVICVEDLNVKGMMSNHKLAKAIATTGWGEFLRQLTYKSEWYGRTVVVIDRFFPSSKTCNNCGYIKEDLSLKDREWECESCKVHIDRDLNASLNILQQGLNMTGLGAKSVIKQKQVESLALVKAEKPEAPSSI
jgi:putative transposase